MQIREFILKMIENNRIISIVGMAKNVGKTTTLNYIINTARAIYNLGLTSIGRDGESKDVIFSTSKPRIYVEKGTIIATAKQCIFNSDITKEILLLSDISSPLGDIVIIKALSDGFVELAGPSKNTDLLKICKIMLKFGCRSVIIDGAINRKSYASPLITNATIISTGASLSNNIDEVVNLTAYTINLLSLKSEPNKKIIELSHKILEIGTIGIISDKYEIKTIDVLSALDAIHNINENLDNNSLFLVIKGVISDRLVEGLMNSGDKYKEITILAEDATKIFLSEKIMRRFQKSGGVLRVLHQINIICVTANPTSPIGEDFNKSQFFEELRQKINIPIFDIVGGIQ